MRRQYPDRPIVAVGAAVCREGRVLIVRRAKPPSEGRWVLPGGAVELGERMREAAAREVREECGIEVTVGEVIGVLDQIVHDEQGRVLYHYAIVDFAARYTRGELDLSDELSGAAWVTPDQFDGYRVPRRAREVLSRALQVTPARED